MVYSIVSPRQILIYRSVYLKFRLCYTKASVKAHTPKGARIPRAPSGRELSAKLTEGECVTMRLLQTQSYAGSFRHATRATASACGWHLGGRLFVNPIISQIGRENNISAEIRASRTVEDAGPYNFVNILMRRSANGWCFFVVTLLRKRCKLRVKVKN